MQLCIYGIDEDNQEKSIFLGFKQHKYEIFSEYCAF